MTCCVSWETKWRCIQKCKLLLFIALLQLLSLFLIFHSSRLSNELLSQISQQPVLRDELVLQICSQLTNNPNAESCGRGWDFLEKVIFFNGTAWFEYFLTCSAAASSQRARVY